VFRTNASSVRTGMHCSSFLSSSDSRTSSAVIRRGVVPSPVLFLAGMMRPMYRTDVVERATHMCRYGRLHLWSRRSAGLGRVERVSSEGGCRPSTRFTSGPPRAFPRCRRGSARDALTKNHTIRGVSGSQSGSSGIRFSWSCLQQGASLCQIGLGCIGCQRFPACWCSGRTL